MAGIQGCTPNPNGTGLVCAPGTDPFASLNIGSNYGLTVPGYDQGNVLGSGLPDLPMLPALPPLVGGYTDASGTAVSSPGNSAPQTAQTGTATPTTSSTATVGGFLALITDLPRMATIFVGFVLLIIGLAMLGAKPAVQIVRNTPLSNVV